MPDVTAASDFLPLLWTGKSLKKVSHINNIFCEVLNKEPRRFATGESGSLSFRLIPLPRKPGFAYKITPLLSWRQG